MKTTYDYSRLEIKLNYEVVWRLYILRTTEVLVRLRMIAGGDVSLWCIISPTALPVAQLNRCMAVVDGAKRCMCMGPNYAATNVDLPD